MPVWLRQSNSRPSNVAVWLGGGSGWSRCLQVEPSTPDQVKYQQQSHAWLACVTKAAHDEHTVMSSSSSASNVVPHLGVLWPRRLSSWRLEALTHQCHP